jgi:hypothetical protein
VLAEIDQAEAEFDSEPMSCSVCGVDLGQGNGPCIGGRFHLAISTVAFNGMARVFGPVGAFEILGSLASHEGAE